jgi:hypothetical protein
MPVLIICTTRRQGVLFARWVLRSLCGEWGYRNSKLTPAEVPTLDKWILEKREIQCEAVVLIQLHKRKT